MGVNLWILSSAESRRMNWNARWIGLGILFGVSVGFAKQSIEVYVGRMEASMSRKPRPFDGHYGSGYDPVYDGYYDGGVAYNATGEYFKAQASFGMGVFHEKPTYSGSFTMGPKYSVLPHLLELHVGGGMGYFGYWEDIGYPEWDEFNYRTPVLVVAEGVLFDRVSLGYSRVVLLESGRGVAILKWKLKLGVQVFSW